MKSTARFQAITAIAVTIISLCALAVSIYQTKILAEQQALATKAEKAQLWPRLNFNSEMEVRQEGFYSLSLYVTNVGVGPAIVENFKLMYKDSQFYFWSYPLEQAFGEVAADSMIAEYLEGMTSNTLKIDQVIPAGQKIKLFNITANEPGLFEDGFNLYVSEDQPRFEVIYRSVFDDRWEVKSKLVTLGTSPEPLP
ncbi:MAG: hypothetical protein AAF741_16700 [Bacteroidota bacterium]